MANRNPMQYDDAVIGKLGLSLSLKKDVAYRSD